MYISVLLGLINSGRLCLMNKMIVLESKTTLNLYVLNMLPEYDVQFLEYFQTLTTPRYLQQHSISFHPYYENQISKNTYCNTYYLFLKLSSSLCVVSMCFDHLYHFHQCYLCFTGRTYSY